MSGMSDFAAKLAASKVSRAVMGWGSWFLSSWVFDDILYPIVIGWLGLITGGIIMASIAIVICWVWLKNIVASDKEWFSMDVMEKIQKKVFWVIRITEGISFIKKSWIDVIEFSMTFVVLNFAFDPMITTLYFRNSDKSKKLHAKDKNIFFWSTIVSNTYWILRSWGVASIVIYVWKFIFY